MSHQVPESVQLAFAKMFNEFEQISREREVDEAEKNPEAYRNSTVIARGLKVRYRYYEIPGARKSERVRFCYMSVPNCAGYFLSFTQIVGKHVIKAQNFHGWPKKKDAIEDARFRYHDALKPPEQRKFTLPKLKFGKRKRKPKAVAPVQEAAAS